MSYTVPAYSTGRDAVGETMIEVLSDACVFEIGRGADGTFSLQEVCDYCFEVKLTKEQLLILADELRRFATDDTFDAYPTQQELQDRSTEE